MTQLEVIWKFMEALNNTTKTDSTEMLDEAIQACSDYDGIEDARQQFLAAVKAASDSTTFLTQCGINISNTDTGGITGADAGGSVTKTSDTTVWEIANTYTANSSATAAQNIFTGTNGWHVQATAYNDTIISNGEDSIDAGSGNDFIYLNGLSEVVITGGDNDTVSVGSGVKNFTVKDFVGGKTTVLGVSDFTSVLSVNSDGTSTVKFTRNGSASSTTLAASNASVDLSKVTTIKGYLNASGNFTGNSTLSSGNFLGNVTSEFDPSFLDVDADGNLSFTCNGLKLNIIGERNPSTKEIITAINSSNISSLEKKYQYVIIAGLYKWWFKEALQLNEEATGMNFTDGSATVTEINLYFENYTSQNWLAYVSHSYYTDSGKAVALSLAINEKYFSSVTDENDTNGKVSGGTLDRTIAHEFNHAVFAANVNFFAKLPIFLKEGMAELIHGVDDSRLSSMRTLLTNSVNNNSNAWLDDYMRTDVISSSNAATLKGGGGAYPYAAGYMFLRWLAKTAADNANAPILSSDKLTARVELRTDGIYYISGKSSDVTTARLVDFSESYSGVSVGSASGNTYTLDTAIKQIVTYFNTQTSWNISGVGSNVTIVADDSATGGDSITGSGSYAIIKSGAGNDTISLSGSRNSITAGAGNDVIYSSGSANFFSYTEGEGNDVIYNFSASDTLEVATKNYTPVVSGSDVIVQVGSGAVTLKGAAGKTLNIVTTEVLDPVCKIGSVTYTSLALAIAAANSGETITLTDNISLTSAVTFPSGKTLTLELNGKTITSTASAALIYGGYLTVKDSSSNHTGSISGASYALQKTGYGSLTINDEVRSISAAWEISGTTGTYKAAGKTAGYAISSDNKTFAYNSASGCETLATITGLNSGADSSDLSVSGKVITLSAEALGTGTASVSGDYTLRLASNVSTPKSTSAYWNISGTTATYFGAGTTAGYVLSSDSKSVTYQNPTGDTLITITNLKEGSTLSGIKLSGTEVTLSKSVLGEATVYISAGYALALGSDVVEPVTTPAYWSMSGTMAIYTAASSTAGHYLMGDARSIRYTAASGGNTLVTVSGLKSGATLDGLSMRGKVVTLNASMLGEESVTISDGYTLALARNVTKTSTTAAHWEISGGVANYIAEEVSAGYVLEDNQINYVAASGGETEITITGLSSRATVKNISVSGTEITLAAAALNKETVTITDGYTLALASDVTTPESTAAHWEISSGTAKYFSEKFSAGYVLENNQIVYETETGGETLIEVTGVSSLDGISLSGKKVTVAAASLNQKTVTVTDGYTLKLASDVTTSASTAAHWEISNGTAKYLAKYTSAGYVLENNQISYVQETGGETLVTVTGVSSLDGISLSGKAVTISAASLNKKTVTVTDGYTLKLASDVITSASTAAHWEISNGTAKYLAKYTSAGYVLENNQISYAQETGGETLVTVTGVSSLDGISLSGKAVTISAASLNQKTVTITDGYTLALASDVTTSASTAAHWEISNGTAKYFAEYTSAGYVLENNQISYAQETGGETLITIRGLRNDASTGGINLNGKEITLDSFTLGTDTVTVSAGYTLALAEDVGTPEKISAHLEISGNTVIFADAETTSGYILVSDGTSIRYVSESGGETLFTITGVREGASTDGISVDGTEVTLSASVLGEETVSISDGYSLKLAEDVSISITTAAHWELSGTTATYLTDSTTAGYTLENNQIFYHAASGETLVTVTGAGSVEGLSLSGSEVVISAAALNEEAVTVDNGYTIRLSWDVPRPDTTEAHWELSGNAATYISEHVTAGYSFESASALIYSEETGGESLVTVTGVASTNGLVLVETEVTVSSAALNQETVTISDGYTLNLSSSVDSPESVAEHWELSGTTATYHADGTSAGYTLENNQIIYYAETGSDVLATVTGVKSLSGISLSGTEITIAAASLNEENVTVSDGYTLALASDVSAPQSSDTRWEISNGTASYLAGTTSAGYTLEDNQITYHEETSGDILATITGLSSGATVDDISMSGIVITISAAALNEENVTVTDGYTLALADDVPAPVTADNYWEISDGTASYIAGTTSAGYTLEDNQIVYHEETSGDVLATITGLSSGATLDDISMSGTVITISAAALNEENVTVTDGYTLALADDVTTSNTTATHWEISGGTANYISEYKTAGYVLADNQISYQPETGGEVSITVSGLSENAATENISLSSTEITLSAAALNQTDVTVSRGYKLKLDSDVTTPEKTAAHWEVASGTANYLSEYTSAGYVENSSGSISYNEATGGDTLITVSGLSSSATVDDISMSGTRITVSAAALNQTDVTVSSGYTLRLASDVATPQTTAAHWEVASGTANYISAYTTAGYTLENGQIVYNEATGGDTLITVSGLSDSATASDISLSGTNITLKAAALNQTDVTVSDGYTLKLASNVTTPETTAAHWTTSSGTANYISAYTTAGYVENSDGTISYNTASGGTTQITVTGLRTSAPASGLSLSGTEVTVMASVLGQNAVAVSSGYTLKLGSDVTVPTDIAPYWYISGTTASYRAASKSSGYVVASDGRSITYAATSGGNTLTMVSGLKRGVTDSELSIEDTVVTVADSALNQRAVTITGNYTLNLASDAVTPYLIAAHWEVSGTTAHYIDDITTAGYVLASDAKSIAYNTQTGGDNLVTVSGLKNNAPVSGLSLSGTEVSLKSSVVDEGAVSVSSGYSLVLSSGSYNAMVTLKGGNSDDTLTNYGSGVVINSGSGADFITNRGIQSSVDAGAGNDTIVNSNYNVTLGGGAGNDVISLSGNLSGVTVNGGVGNDTIYGDNGRHLYTYAKGDGYDAIYAFNERDTLQITSGTVSKATVSGDDVVFTVNTGSVTLKEARGKKITTADAKGNASTFIYDDGMTYEENKTSVTLASSFSGTLNTSDYSSSVLEIDGSDVTSAVNLNGNAKANTIYGGAKADYISGGANADVLIGGAGADTLSGDAGDDTLTGGDGVDTFIYSSGGGNDVITDFADGTDKLKLASGSIDSVGFNKSNVIFKIGKGSVTVADGKDKKITIIDSAGGTTTYIYGDKMTYNGERTSVTLASNFRGTLASSDYSTSVTEINASGVSNITRIIGNTLANTISGGTKADTILGGGGNDSISGNNGKDVLYGGTGNDVLSGGAGNDTLYGETGNDTLTGGSGSDTFVYSSGDGNDTITDYTAGQDKIKIASGSISGGSVSGSDVVLKVGTGALTVANAKDKKISIVNSSGKTSTQIYGASGTYNENKSAITLASNLSGTLNASDYDSAVTYIDGTKLSNGLRINGNAKANTIYGGAKADYISGGGGKDKLIGGDGNDTLAGGAGNDTLTGGDGSNVFVYGSGEGNDVITDYTSGADKIQLTSGTISSASVKGSDIILKVGSGSVTVQGGKDKKISVTDASGTTATRIYTTGMTYDENQLGVTLTSNYRGTLSADNYASSVATIDASKTASALKIFGNDKANTITGTGKADCISGGANGDLLIGGAGNDTLSGDKGNDTLTGGKGNDFFAYSDGDGNDLITDYTAGQDRIKIVSGSIESASVSGSDVVLKVVSGSVKIANAKDKKVTIIDAAKQTSTYIYSDGLAYDENKTSATLYSAFKGALGTSDYASTVKVIDASAVTSAVQITGTSKANTITGGTKADCISGGAGNDLILGGAGNDTLNGDAGNDTLTGGAGSDIFVYAEGEGNDVITDYTSGQDRIKLASGSISSAALSGSNVVFKIGKNSLTLKDAANTSISVIDANNKYATYSLSSGVSGTANARQLSFAGYWFTENNFDGAQLDSIMDVSADYSAAAVETQDAENLAQISLASYSEK